MKKILLVSSAFMVISGMLFVQLPSAHSNGGGAPNGASGSPGDNRTCATSGCHTGTASARPGMITANIPVQGYIPGQTYTITVGTEQAGINKWGFQASPQNVSGNLLGTLVNTDNIRTQLTGSGKYITHRAAGNSGSGSNSWSFDWIAPVAGTGEVTIYTSVNAANGTGSTAGDLIFTDALTVQEDESASVGSDFSTLAFSVYPNPAEGNTLFINGVKSNSPYQLMDMSGRVILSGVFEYTNNVNTIDLTGLMKGVYLVKTDSGNSRFIRK